MRYFVCVIMLLLVSVQTYAQEFPISTATGDQLGPDVAYDGTNFWVVWGDKRSGDFEIYGARVSPTGQVLDTAGICLAAGTKFIMPSVAFGDTIGGVAFQHDTSFIISIYPDTSYHSPFRFVRFYPNGEIIDSLPPFSPFVIPGMLPGGMDNLNVPICVFGENNFFFFAEFDLWNDFEGWRQSDVTAVENDSIKTIAYVPGFFSWAVTGIWNGERFLAVWTQWPLDTCEISGAFLEDSLGEQEVDTLQFKIRDENDFPPGVVSWNLGDFSPRSKELAYSGSRYLLISETGREYNTTSKIWFDVLSADGLPIDSLPTIIDHTDSVNQTYPTCTYKDGKFVAVWQESSSVGVQLYGMTIDTMGEILCSTYLSSGSNKIQPSITTGAGKLFLVWADDRNGNFDIYGMIMDSLVAIEENRQTGVLPTFLKCEPTPFINRVKVSYSISNPLSLKIYDLSGRIVRQFNHLTNQPLNQIIWDATDDKGNRVQAGVYFCKLGAGKEHKVAKLILMR